MRLSSALEAVSGAIHHAAYVALPTIHYQEPDYAQMRSWTAEARHEARRTGSAPMVAASRRPEVADCEVFAMFSQTWGSTALGFGGMGGAAMTPAYTVVVKGPEGQFVTYWAGRFAYLVDPAVATPEQVEKFLADVAARHTARRADSAKVYGASADVESADDGF